MIGFSADREVAHFAFDAPLVAAMPSGRETFIEDFGQDGLMPSHPVVRGE